MTYLELSQSIVEVVFILYLLIYFTNYFYDILVTKLYDNLKQ